MSRSTRVEDGRDVPNAGRLNEIDAALATQRELERLSSELLDLRVLVGKDDQAVDSSKSSSKSKLAVPLEVRLYGAMSP